jgi:hypothetical protein
MMYSNPKVWKKPRCRIKYTIEAVIENHDNTKLQYAQLLLIQTPPDNFQQFQTEHRMIDLKDCCVNKGLVGMSVTFDKNVFFNHETATA